MLHLQYRSARLIRAMHLEQVLRETDFNRRKPPLGRSVSSSDQSSVTTLAPQMLLQKEATIPFSDRHVKTEPAIHAMYRRVGSRARSLPEHRSSLHNYSFQSDGATD